MLSATLLAVLAVLAALGPAAAQSSLYSSDGCRITARLGFELNVTCTCSQKLRQTADSSPINHLEITGCLADDPSNQREARLTFLPPGRAAEQFDFVLSNVRSVNISQARLRLEPVRGRPEAAGLPLRRLHIELGELTSGLPDGALQGLPSLEVVSLDLIQADRAAQSALADLPLLQELAITNSHFQFISAGLVARTPRLRRLRFTNSKFDFMFADAIVVENDNDDDLDGSGACLSDDDDSFLDFSGMVVNTMSTNAVRVGPVRRLLASNNSIGVMYSGALNVSLRAPADCPALLRFTRNTVTDMRDGAVTVENETPTPVYLELGANILLQSALSPHELRLQGGFEWRPVAGLPPDQFECSCCQCPSTRQLIEVAVQPQPSQLDTDAFVTALGGARCAGDTERSFLEFASGCVPDADLRARVASLIPLPSTPPPPPPSAAWRLAAGPLTPLLLLLSPLTLAAAGRG